MDIPPADHAAKGASTSVFCRLSPGANSVLNALVSAQNSKASRTAIATQLLERSLLGGAETGQRASQNSLQWAVSHIIKISTAKPAMYAVSLACLTVGIVLGYNIPDQQTTKEIAALRSALDIKHRGISAALIDRVNIADINGRLYCETTEAHPETLQMGNNRPGTYWVAITDKARSDASIKLPTILGQDK